MSDIFISHVEENSSLAVKIAQGLEQNGFSTWYYERDSLPGPSYLLQTATEIEKSQAVVIIISPHSLGSHQVTKEVIRAHESGKPFIPILTSITHVEFSTRQPEWREAIGSATSITVPRGGVAQIMPRILDGLRGLGIAPSKSSSSSSGNALAAPERPARLRLPVISTKLALWVAIGAVVATSGTVGVIALNSNQAPTPPAPSERSSLESQFPVSIPTSPAPGSVSPAKPPPVGKVGDTLVLVGGTPARKVEVTLLQVIDPAKTNKDVYIDDADRLSAYRLRIKNVGNEIYDDDPVHLAEVVDEQGRQYEANPFDHIDPGFGHLRIAPGVQIEGVITFEIPRALRLIAFLFSSTEFNGDVGRWTL